MENTTKKFGIKKVLLVLLTIFGALVVFWNIDFTGMPVLGGGGRIIEIPYSDVTEDGFITGETLRKLTLANAKVNYYDTGLLDATTFLSVSVKAMYANEDMLVDATQYTPHNYLGKYFISAEDSIYSYYK